MDNQSILLLLRLFVFETKTYYFPICSVTPRVAEIRDANIIFCYRASYRKFNEIFYNRNALTILLASWSFYNFYDLLNLSETINIKLPIIFSIKYFL